MTITKDQIIAVHMQTYLLCAEFGYKAHEAGMNIETMRIELQKLLKGDDSPEMK